MELLWDYRWEICLDYLMEIEWDSLWDEMWVPWLELPMDLLLD